MIQWNPKKFLEMQGRDPQLTREEFEFLRPPRDARGRIRP
jgi:hypothetical protein